MHRHFGDWYRSAGIEPDGDWLAKRWTAIADFDPDSSEILSLAKLFYKIGTPADDFLAGFRGTFQTADPAFKMRDNDHELSVLAGAQLVDVLERSTDHADIAALALVCAAANNLRPPPSVRDIPEIAARHLSNRTADRASPENDGDGIGSNEALFTALKAQPSPSPELAKALQQQARQLSLVREESNILWWLFSEHSRDGEQPWSVIPPAALPLMAGKELADLTQVIPGPIAARAFLDRVIRCGRGKPAQAITITDAINSAALAWRQGFTKGYGVAELEELSPILRGIQISIGSPQDNAWVPVFVQATGIAATARLAPSILAHQVFLETMLHCLWKRVNA